MKILLTPHTDYLTIVVPHTLQGIIYEFCKHLDLEEMWKNTSVKKGFALTDIVIKNKIIILV